MRGEKLKHCLTNDNRTDGGICHCVGLDATQMETWQGAQTEAVDVECTYCKHALVLIHIYAFMQKYTGAIISCSHAIVIH